MNLLDIGDYRQSLMILAIVMTRITTIMILTPFLSTTIITGAGRNAVILSLSLILFPLLIPAHLDVEIGNFELMGLLVKEGILGTFIGFLSSLAFYITQSAGFFIDNQRGATLASVFNPLFGEQTSPLGSAINVIVTALFYVIGGFLAFLSIIYASYITWPIFSFYPQFDGRFPLFFLAVSDHFMRSTVLLSAPIVFVMFLSDFCLGMINRFAPQLQVFFLSLPIKSAVSMLILIFYMSTFFALSKLEFSDSLIMIEFLHKIIS
jgi:type III secretion protein T